MRPRLTTGQKIIRKKSHARRNREKIVRNGCGSDECVDDVDNKKNERKKWRKKEGRKRGTTKL